MQAISDYKLIEAYETGALQLYSFLEESVVIDFWHAQNCYMKVIYISKNLLLLYFRYIGIFWQLHQCVSYYY
jgi:hypothetical protein